MNNAYCCNKWIKMTNSQRAEFVRFMVENQKEEHGSLGHTENQEHGFEGAGIRVWFGWADLTRIAERQQTVEDK